MKKANSIKVATLEAEVEGALSSLVAKVEQLATNVKIFDEKNNCSRKEQCSSSVKRVDARPQEVYQEVYAPSKDARLDGMLQEAKSEVDKRMWDLEVLMIERHGEDYDSSIVQQAMEEELMRRKKNMGKSKVTNEKTNGKSHSQKGLTMGKEEFKGKVTSSKGNKKKEVETTKEMLEEQKETNPKVILVDKMSLIGSKEFDGKGLETNLVLKGKVKDMGKGKKKKSFVSTQSSLENSDDEEALALDGSCLDTLFSTSNGNEDERKEQEDEKLGKSRKGKGTKEKKTQDAFYTTLDISTKPKELNPRGSTMSLHPICLREGAIEYKIKTRGSPSPFASVKAIINPELLELDPNKLQEYLTTKLTLNFNKATPFS